MELEVRSLDAATRRELSKKVDQYKKSLASLSEDHKKIREKEERDGLFGDRDGIAVRSFADDWLKCRYSFDADVSALISNRLDVVHGPAQPHEGRHREVCALAPRSARQSRELTSCLFTE
jgi:hypothetical protein